MVECDLNNRHFLSRFYLSLTLLDKELDQELEEEVTEKAASLRELWTRHIPGYSLQHTSPFSIYYPFHTTFHSSHGTEFLSFKGSQEFSNVFQKSYENVGGSWRQSYKPMLEMPFY